MTRIFVSYSHTDSDFARRLARDLKQSGAQVWIDAEDIPAGAKWDRAVQDGLDNCQIMLVIITPQSVDSLDVEQEWQSYLDDNKPVIPILLDPARMHFQLRRIQYIDFHGQAYDAAMLHLAEELQRHGITLAGTSTPPVETTETVTIPTAECGPIFQAMSQFFNDDHWFPEPIEGLPAIRMKINGKNGNWQCYASARESQQQFVFYSVCDVKIREDKRPTVVDFLTRANYGLIVGNFEMDLNDGEVRYKTSIDVEGDELTPALLRNLAYTNVKTMDRYLPGLMSVMYGALTSEQAIHMVED
jgi:hypothetical protein